MLIHINLRLICGIVYGLTGHRESLRPDMSSLDTMQAGIFTTVEGAAYSWVMITGNLRQAIERLFALVSEQRGSLRQLSIFATVYAAFGTGAAVGAYATKNIPDAARGPASDGATDRPASLPDESE